MAVRSSVPRVGLSLVFLAALAAACASGTGDNGSTDQPATGGQSGAGGGQSSTSKGGNAGTSAAGAGVGGASGTGATTGKGGNPGAGGDGGAGTGGAAAGTGGTGVGPTGGATGKGGASGAAGTAGSAGTAGAGKGGASGAAGAGGAAAGASGAAGAGGNGGSGCVPCMVPNKAGQCAEGCVSGAVCKQVIFPATEICNGLDDDCDTVADNGPPWGDTTGMACDTGKLGVCGAGTNLCKKGSELCQQNVQKMAEVCNGLDDDCDGVVDNGTPGGGMPCTVPGQMPNTPCATGSTTCTMGGQNTCVQTYKPQVEVCDGIDNDCNGSIDDPVALNGLPCKSGLPGICAPGKSLCTGGSGSCIPNITPGSAVETCNGLDDDCNGMVDDFSSAVALKSDCTKQDPAAGKVSTWVCVSGTCTILACAPGFADCDGAPANGCETQTTNDNSNCGQCSNVCSVTNGTPACVASACTIASCSAGFADCDSNPANGCEINTNTSVGNCGTCGMKCPAAGGTPACVAGVCGVSGCAAGFADCNGKPGDGCEVNIDVSPQNCGGCGSVCTVPNATASCAAGACGIGSCNPGFLDCNAKEIDGCEIAKNTDPLNCGACGTACAVANGTPGCAVGQCTVASCNPGYKDCDGMAANGCEINSGVDVANCGSCGKVCGTPNGTPVCTSGTCATASCNAGFKDCDGLAANGCEININNDPKNCNGCGIVCSGSGGTPACNAGVCGVSSCNPGFADCDGNPANGCEVNTTNDPNNCNACNAKCALANATSTCVASACAVVTCSAGFGNCNNVAADGCETNTNTNVNDCGSCGNKCATANGTPGCASGMCTVASCTAGFANCNGLVSDGCETNTTSDGANCGTCGHSCATSCTGNVTSTSCVGAACAVTGCSAGYFDTDKTCSDGCECKSSATGATCATPTSLGAPLTVGQVTTYTGNLVPNGQEAWLSVTFTGNGSPSYHPHVKLTTGAAEFQFDINTNCSGGVMACCPVGAGLPACVEMGKNSTGDDDWEVSNSNEVAPATSPVPAVGTGGSILIHVTRRSGFPVSCNNYTLTISN